MVRRCRWMVLWTLLVLYPDPRLLVTSIAAAWRPPLDPSLVRELAASLPDDPAAIERYVNGTLLPYAVPWKTYGVPWYFPTPATALARGEGDCQARAVVFASILRAKGIPATLVGSFDHLWVDYPHKTPTKMENQRVAFVVASAGGTYRMRPPRDLDVASSWRSERSYFWDPMPTSRLLLLIYGWILLGLRLDLVLYDALARVRTRCRPASVIGAQP